MNLKVGVQDKELDNLLLKIQRLQKELAKIDIRINPDGFKELDDQLKKAMSDFEALYLKINEAKFKPTVDISELVKLQDEILKMRELFETKVVMPSTPEGADMNQKMVDKQKELNKGIEEYRNQQATLSQEAKKLANDVLGSYGQNIKALSRVEGELKVVTTAKNQLNKAERDGLISTQDAIKERSSLINRELQLKASKNELQAILRNEIKTMQTAEGSIQAMALQLTRLQNTYDNLNAAERNSAQGKGLLAHIQQTEQEFLKLNQTMNVGKITAAGTGFNSLGMSIQQVARELPSLKMGFGTFMLAISNNLPILADELQRAKTKYTDLVSTGQKATPVWKQVISNLFSWQTALVAGVTALTLFAPKIVEWVDGLIKGNNTLKSTKELQESINEEFKNGSSSVGEQIVKINNLSDKWSILGGNLDKQKKFIVENKSEFDSLGISITNVHDAQNLLIDNKDVFISYLKEMAKATAASKLAADEYAKAIEKENEIRLMGIDPNKIQEVDKLKGGSISRDYVKAKVLNDERKEIEKNADALFHLGKAYESEAKKSLDAAGIKKSAKDKDKTKSTESAAEKARKLNQELLNLQSKLSNEQIRQQIESDQKLIDRQEEGFNKQFEQNKLNYKKELQQIKEFEDEKTKERAEAIIKFGKDNVPVNLSEANIKVQVDTMKNDALLSFEKANSDTLKNLTDKYQSYADQRLEIEKKFNKDIEALQSQLPENMLADLKSQMLDLFGNGIGNVDLLARPMIDAAELVKKGWEDAGNGIATVFSSQFGISDSKGKEHEILVTPILPNGDVLSPDDLSNYVDNILSGSEDILKADNLGIVIGIDVNKDGSAGEVLHQLQEQMVNIKKYAPEVEEKIRKLIAKATTDKGKDLISFDFERMKEAPEYIRAFEDLGTTSTETLNSLLGQFERFKEEAAKTLSPKELREYTTTIQSIADELSNRDLYSSLIKQKDEAVKANQRLIKAENDLRLVKLGIGDPLLTEEEAIKRVNKAKDEYYNKNKKVLDTQKKIREQISALAKEMSGLGNALGGTSGEIISFIGDITSFYTTASEGIEKVAQTGAQAISVVEKASVILTIISTAIQLMKQLNSILPDAFNQYEKYDEKIERINDMRDAVNEYEIAVLKANQAENSWFGNDSLRNLKDYKELQTKIFDSYRDKMLEEQAIYENKGSGGWLTNTFKSAVSWVSKITYGFDLLNKKYKEGTTAALNNLRIETRKKSSGFLGSGIGGKSQKTEDLQTWINNNKDLFKKGLDTQLFGADGMLNQELAGVILEKYGDKLVGQTKETLEELKTLTEQYNEFRAQLREYVNSLYEPLVDNMVSSIWDWFDEGKNALDSFKDYAKQTFRDIVSDMIKTILLKDVFKDFKDNIAKLYEEYSKGNLTEAQLSEAVAKETNAVMDRYKNQLPAIQGMVDSINQNIKDATGIDLKNTDKSKGSSQTPSSGYSVSMSQDTGDKLIGIQTSSQMRLISLDNNVARIAQWNQPVSEKFNFDTIAMPLGALSQSSIRIERMMEENRNIQVQMFYKVSDIEKWSRVLPQMNEVLGQIERNTRDA